MSSKADTSSRSKDTILLVQAKPKYTFQGKKLPKDIGSNFSQEITKEKTNTHSLPHNLDTSKSQDSKLVGNISQQNVPPRLNNSGKTSKPVAVVGASYQDETKSAAKSTYSVTGHEESVPRIQPKFRSDVPRCSPASPTNFSLSSSSEVLGSGSANHPSQATLLAHPLSSNLKAPSENLNETALTSEQVQQDLSLALLDSCLEQNRSERLEHERDTLRQELDVQLQVNSELKKLLIASVGEDLGERVERLARDRAQLSMDIGGFSKKMSEDYENYDKVSIQADMWRSKYLASRVMIEELGNARAYYSLQCHDAQDALQQLLNERHELRTNLLEAYRVLQQVKTAFDPLNSHRSSSLASTNVLELTRACQQLAEAVRFRLLPSHVAVPVGTDGENDSWENSVTRAEQFAHEVLSRPREPSGSLQSGSSRLLPVTGPMDSQINRFHPNTCHDNLTFNCCIHCKGDISIL